MSFNAFDMTDPATNAHVDVQADHYKVVREIGAAGTVLLKNVAGALPLKKPNSIAVIGKPNPTKFCSYLAQTSDWICRQRLRPQSPRAERVRRPRGRRRHTRDGLGLRHRAVPVPH